MNRFRIGIAVFFIAVASSFGQERSDRDLQILYLFENDKGNSVVDSSGLTPGIDLEVKGRVSRKGSAIELTGKNYLKSKTVPKRLISALKKSREITVEAWVEKPDLKQGGPARLLTLSKNTNERNFTLGQEKSAFDFRLRTTGTSRNGLPSIASGNGTVKAGLTHIVFTKDKGGKGRFYINGTRKAEKNIRGDFSNWDENYHLAIGNELSGDRPWNGLIHLVAIYSRSLEESEIDQHFQIGPTAKKREPTPDEKQSENELLFSEHVAPVLSNHCLECHDASTRKGDLDLSSREAVFASIDAEDLWESIESDEMPHKRPPLDAKEKELVLNWVKGGAHWSIKGTLDPANYIYHGRNITKTLRRLTVDEYIATVKSTLGVDIAGEALEILPRDLRADGFSNTAYNLNVDFQHVEAYSKLASLIVEKIPVSEFASRFWSRHNVNDKDMRALISRMGAWVLRGELEEYEIDSYRGITTSVVSSGGGFEEAVTYLLEAMLQSPRFVYRIESDRSSLTGDELASRLSYMIWGTSPDEMLREKAERGELFDRDACRTEIKRMLKDPLARQRSLQFAEQWLNLPRLQNMKPNSKHFPNWTPGLADDMRSETLAYYEEVVWNRKLPMSKLLNEPITYLTPALAKHYGIKYTGDGELTKHELSKVPERGGLLTQGSILTIGGDDASMVTRGLFVLNNILRSIVKDPPPCVDTTPVPTKSGLTQRAIAEDRIANKSCGGCHSKFEPLAFGLEKFDGIGAFHHRDSHGNQLHDHGEILFPGQADSVSYQNSNQLMDLLAGSDRVSETIAWKVTQFSIGRPLRSDDLSTMEQIISLYRKNGGTYHGLIEAIALSDLIQKK